MDLILKEKTFLFSQQSATNEELL